jgi:hypothetical protein
LRNAAREINIGAVRADHRAPRHDPAVERPGFAVAASILVCVPAAAVAVAIGAVTGRPVWLTVVVALTAPSALLVCSVLVVARIAERRPSGSFHRLASARTSRTGLGLVRPASPAPYPLPDSPGGRADARRAQRHLTSRLGLGGALPGAHPSGADRLPFRARRLGS